MFDYSGRSFACNSVVRAAGYRSCQGTNGSFSRGMGGMAREIAGVSLHPREKKSGYYRNLQFDNTCIGAIALCLANVSVYSFEIRMTSSCTG